MNLKIRKRRFTLGIRIQLCAKVNIFSDTIKSKMFVRVARHGENAFGHTTQIDQ